MKRIVKYLAICILVVTSLGLSSCAKQEGQPRQRKDKFQVASKLLSENLTIPSAEWHILCMSFPSPTVTL